MKKTSHREKILFSDEESNIRIYEYSKLQGLTPMVRRQRLSKWKTIYDLETAWLNVGPTESPVIDKFSSDEDI